MAMVFGKSSMADCKSGLMALLMAIVSLWATLAIAGVNEDLFAAAMSGDLPKVERLIAAGANVNAKDNNSGTALIWASARGHEGVVQALLDKGAEVNAKDNNGRTALMFASLNGSKVAVQALLSKGAEANARAKDGNTASMLASQKGHKEVAELLAAEVKKPSNN
jgi:ankyrin repeat protein